MKPARLRVIVVLLIPIIIIGEFILDVLTPLGLAEWILYVVPLLLSVFIGNSRLSFPLAAILSVLTLAGFYLSPPGIDPHWAFLSRLVGIAVLWMMALVIRLRMQAEEALEKSRGMLRSVLDTIPARVFWKDMEGRYLGCNQPFARDAGVDSPEALLGKDDHALVWKNQADLYRADDKAVITSGVPKLQYEEPETTPTGTQLCLRTSKTPLRDLKGRIIGVLGTYEDITDYKRVHDQLTESGKYFDKIVNSVADPIFVKDRQHRWMLLNDAFCDFMGHKRDELMGKTDRDFFPKSEADEFWSKDEIVLNTGTENVNEEKFTDAAGNTHTIVTKKTLYTNEKGEKFIVGIIRDITEHKQTVNELRAEHEFIQEIIFSASEGIVVYDQELRYRLWNRFMEQLTGLSSEEVLGRKALELFPHLQEQGVDRLLARALKGETVHTEDIPFHTPKTGKKGWVRGIYGPHRGAAGKIIGVIGMVRDVSERKQAEAEIAHLATFPMLNPAPVVEVDKSGQVYFLNHAAAKKFPDLKTRGILHPYLYDWDSTFTAIQVAPNASLGRQVTIGNSCYQQVMQYVADSQHVYIYGFDITDRREAEEQSRGLARLLDLAHDAIVVRDMDDRIMFWNKGAEQLFGWTAPEALGRNAWQLLHKEIFKYQEVRKSLLEKGKGNSEFTCWTKNGQEIIIESRFTLIRDNQGTPKSILGISTDITEKKKLETQFLRAQRMESLGTLAGGIAHDLNNVLSPLLFSLLLLKEKITDAAGQELLDMLEANVQRGTNLVKQVLAFGRGVEGERIAIHPAQIAREIKHIINETFPKSVEFEYQSTPDLWNITGDPTQLHQVLLNLCVNARDAMPHGGKLSIHIKNLMLDKAHAEVNPGAKPGPHVVISVRDTGVGMPKEVQDKMFEPFFTTKETGKGTGLGLSTTLTIVKSHGGFINCYSEVGKGTTFKVYLPGNTTPAVVEKAEKEEAKLPSGHDELVLIVDDEEAIRKVAQRTLERHGYRVLLAADGAEAVTLYASHRNEIAAVITDMAMPIMDGPATIVALKAINPGIKIVTTSGLASQGGLAKAMGAGVRKFIPKPYTAEAMLLALHEMLNGKN
jgi:PAS domain S-box-containing protein